MQLMIDTDETNPAELRRTASYLLDLAFGRDGLRVEAIPDEATAQKLMAQAKAAMTPPAEAAAEDGIALAVAAQAVPVPPPPPPPVTSAAGQAAGTPQTAPASTAASPQLDKRGFPHDARIHSKEPKLNADGTWRARRNLDNAELKKVEGELRAAGYGGQSVTVNVGPGVASVQVPLPPPVGAPAAPVVAAPDAAAPAQVMVPPPPPVAAPVSTSAFQVLMQRVSRNAQGVCSNAAIAPTWAKVGVKGWADFFQRPDLIPAMTAELDALGAAP